VDLYKSFLLLNFGETARFGKAEGSFAKPSTRILAQFMIVIRIPSVNPPFKLKIK